MLLPQLAVWLIGILGLTTAGIAIKNQPESSDYEVGTCLRETHFLKDPKEIGYWFYVVDKVGKDYITCHGKYGPEYDDNKWDNCRVDFARGSVNDRDYMTAVECPKWPIVDKYYRSSK